MINGFRFNKEIKMKNKRTLVVSTVTVLVVILGVAAFLAYTGSTSSLQLIPITGGSSSGGSQSNQIAPQNQAANIASDSQSDPSWDHISGQPGLLANPGRPTDLDPSWDHISGD
jgi:hypothetical protein